MISSHELVLPPPIGTSRRVRNTATSTTAASVPLFACPTIVPVSSTNATPVVMTLAAGHPFANGDVVTVAGHTTNTGANGSWTLSAVTATTVTLTGAVGNGVGGATGTIAWTDTLFAVPDCKVWVCFEALTNDCFIRIGTSQTAGTTSNNGSLIMAHLLSGGPGASAPQLAPGNLGPKYYLTPSIHTHVDVVSTVGAGVLKWWICSPPGERERI